MKLRTERKVMPSRDPKLITSHFLPVDKYSPEATFLGWEFKSSKSFRKNAIPTPNICSGLLRLKNIKKSSSVRQLVPVSAFSSSFCIISSKKLSSSVKLTVLVSRNSSQDFHFVY